MSDQQHQPIESEDEDDALLTALSAERNRRRAGPSETPAPAAPAPAAPPAQPSAQDQDPAPAASAAAAGEGPAPAPPADAGIESSPWFASLPPEAQESLRALAGKSSQAEQEAQRLRASLDRTTADYHALHGRLSPTQRRLEEAQRRLAQFEQAGGAARQPQQPAQTQAAAPNKADVDAWVARQAEAVRSYFEQYPGEAYAAYAIAESRVQEAVESKMAKLREEMQAEFRRANLQAGVRELRARHGDVDQYMVDRTADGQVIPRTEQGKAYLERLARAAPEIQEMAWADDPGAVAAALDVYKWERDNPEYSETLALPEFKEWARDLTGREVQMVFSADLRERKRILGAFWRDYDATAQARTETPEAKRAREIAEARGRQRQQVAPSPRVAGAPASAAAADPEEAGLEAVAAMRAAWRAKQLR